jgi:hypothetical protein
MIVGQGWVSGLTEEFLESEHVFVGVGGGERRNLQILLLP